MHPSCTLLINKYTIGALSCTMSCTRHGRKGSNDDRGFYGRDDGRGQWRQFHCVTDVGRDIAVGGRGLLCSDMTK